ncbi:MAG TPA: S53 family peptidase [Isosphaeraceae bacterium]|nr:S53 family peptidase [Isosphaeraceae bacterium]
MPRPDRSRPTVRLRPNLSLERLEERQLLSTVPLATLSALPPMLPDIQPVGIIPLSSPTSYPSAVYTPSQVRTAYGVNKIPDEGQGMTVAIVDAYSQPYIQSDVNTFSSLFGLPQMDGVGGDPTLSIMVPPGQSTPPPANTEPGNWGREISLDVEWVHSIAPYANIDLVTCQDSSGDSLYGAEADGLSYASGVGYAKSLPGVVVVSNSYGGPEFSGETAYDSQFTTSSNNVAFVFSTGDSGAPAEYPAYSPNVVAVGGTSLYTLSIKGQYGSEIGWSGSGGGVSLYEPTPSYQSSNGVNYGMRSVPDVSWLADPNTGVLVIDSLDAPGEILIAGGTSLAAPMWAGLIALGDQARGSAGSLSSTGVLDSLYGAYNSSNYSADFHDITVGNNGFAAGPGYDLVTGIGTPKAQNIVNLLGTVLPPAVSIGSQTVNTGPSAGLSTVSYNSGKSVSVYSKPLPISINSVSTDVALSDFVTTVDIPKAKKIGSLLFS